MDEIILGYKLLPKGALKSEDKMMHKKAVLQSTTAEMEFPGIWGMLMIFIF